ncbi:hypothetical protein SALBM217S_07595 [Streptomyces griseoloalbus]
MHPECRRAPAVGRPSPYRARCLPEHAGVPGLRLGKPPPRAHSKDVSVSRSPVGAVSWMYEAKSATSSNANPYALPSSVAACMALE